MGKNKMFLSKNKEKPLHPASRRAKAISKKLTRAAAMNRKRGQTNMRLQMLGDKLAWFKVHMDTSLSVYTPTAMLDLIQRYIGRNNEELEELRLMSGVGRGSRESLMKRRDLIQFTLKNETREFECSGFETVDLLDERNLLYFKLWKGDLRYLPQITLRSFRKAQLEKLVASSPLEHTMTLTTDEDEQMEDVERGGEEINSDVVNDKVVAGATDENNANCRAIELNNEEFQHKNA